MTVVLTITGLGIQAAPSSAPASPGPDKPFSLPLPFGLGPQVALANYCASGPAFTGKLTQQLVNSGTPTTAARITSSTVYGYLSNIEASWSCTLYRRYSGLTWNTTAAMGYFDFGTVINSTSVSCNWLVGTTDYLKANGTTSCWTTDTADVLSAQLTAERTYRADVNHNTVGDFSFVHSDCDTTPYYGAEVTKGSEASPVSFSTGATSNRPGANCDPITLDSTGTSQTVTYDGTPPTVAITQPATGGPVTVPSAFYTVQFNASDAVAGFGGADGWSLQRQVATWSGSACGTFANDTAAGNLVTGTTAGSGQLSGQSLAVGACYRWTLTATDQNGNTAATVTSGTIHTDTSGVLGDQRQLRTESWDLGAGDTLALSVGSGNVRLSHPVVSLPIRGSSVAIGLAYNSQDPTNVGFGPGWRLNIQRRLALNADGSVTFTDETGARHTFTSPVTNGTVTTYTRPATLYGTLVKDTSQAVEFTLTYRDQSVDTFDIAGSEALLTRTQDRFGNGVTLGYAAGTSRISTITDTAASPNRVIDFGYDGSNRLTSITDWAYVSGGVVQTGATGSRRVNRFFYDGSSNLAGWADALDATDSCPAATVASHVTCLGYGAGLLTTITRKLTTLGADSLIRIALPPSYSQISTTIAYVNADAASITDADGGSTTLSHPGLGQTTVRRPGTPASTTTYTLAPATDVFGRITSVRRKLGAASIEQVTGYGDASQPTEATAVTENNGALLSTPARTTSSSYVTGSMGLVARMTEPLTASTNRTTDFIYNVNNDVTQKTVALDGSGTTRVITRSCYDAGCTTSGAGFALLRTIDNYIDGTAGNGAANVEDVTSTFQSDAYGQRTRETRANYNAAGTLLDQAATGRTYGDKGNQPAEIRNYANGTVTNPGDDITPNATTGARTDLTTSYGYDTAGNRVTTADPRRAVEVAKGTSLNPDDFVTTSAFDPLNEQLSERSATTPGEATQPTQTWTYDELGIEIEHIDTGGVYTAVTTTATGLAATEWQDTDGSGPANDRVTTSRTFDASGRVLTLKTAEQRLDASLGKQLTMYDELGRSTDVTDASGSSPDVSSVAHTSFDALGRTTSTTSGYGGAAAQTTTTTYDLGGRSLSTDDEFTCTSTAYDYRDLATSIIEGQTSGTCTGAGTRTTTITNDALSRVGLRAITAGTGTGDQPEANTYDAAGNKLVSSRTQSGTTTTTTHTVDPLDQVTSEVRSDGSTTKSNFDAAGNTTDRCTWTATPSEGCKPADQAFGNPQPVSVSSSAYDARNQRISLKLKLGSSAAVATTTYDPAHNYQISRFYLPTAAGKEAQDLYSYDVRHRLSSITHQLCVLSTGHACSSTTPTGSSTYAYDDNDNRTTVTESSTGGTATTRNYCYDALDQLRAEKTTTACTTTSGDETYTFDVAGNRTTATLAGVTRTFGYGTDGQLDTCVTPTCSVSYDSAGRMATVTDNGVSWTFAYDGDGRMTSACAGSTCSGSGFNRVDDLYDGEGHRVQIKETTAGGTVTKTDLRYAGDTIVAESVNGSLTRTYATDDIGRIMEVCDPDCATGTVYLVTWNGHGDATGLWRQNADGTLTLANSYTYGTWGTPTTTVAPGFSDLHFRFLYVGASDVQWDNSFGLGLVYMHARHYSPTLGRFLQPDPARADGNLYRYAADSPVTKSDPSGNCWQLLALEEFGPVAWGATVFCVGAVALATVVWSHAAYHYLSRDNWWAENPGSHTTSPSTAYRPCYRCWLILSSAGAAQRDIERGHAPDGIERVDKRSNFPSSQDEVHVNGGSIKRDGVIKHPLKGPLTRAEKDWMRRWGFKIPGQ